MKKLLVLGGAKAQVQLINAAKEAGIYVVLCDWTTTNPGVPLADKHYQVSTMDLDAVSKVAELEKVDGVVTNSEPAVYNATCVAERLGLLGNPLDGIEALLSKSKFRNLQREIGAFAPMSFECKDKDEFLKRVKSFSGKFVVKPVQCSGSRGTTCFDSATDPRLGSVFDECVEYSRSASCAVEEYVEMPSLTVIEGDVFVYEGHFLWDGVFDTNRSRLVPFVPMTYSFPPDLDEMHFRSFKSTVTQLLLRAGIRFGAFNVEAYFTRVGDLFVIEVNPRQGGMSIPLRIKEYSGIDQSRLLVTLAVGDESYFNGLKSQRRSLRYLTYHNVYSHRNGVYRGLRMSSEIKSRVFRVEERVQEGSQVQACVNGSGVLAHVCMEFHDADDRKRFVTDIEQHIVPEVIE